MILEGEIRDANAHWTLISFVFSLGIINVFEKDIPWLALLKTWKTVGESVVAKSVIFAKKN